MFFHNDILFLSKKHKNMVGVAQLVRAPVCGTGGRGFKSLRPPHLPISRNNRKKTL